MKNIIQVFLFLLLAAPLWAQQKKVSVINDQSGSRLIVNGKPFMVNGSVLFCVSVAISSKPVNFGCRCKVS